MAKKTDENVKKTKKAVKEEKTKKKTVAKAKESAKATKTLQNATNVKEELTTKETKKKALDGAKKGLKTNSEKGLKTVKKIDANENVPEAVVSASGKSKTKKKHNKNKFNNSKKHPKTIGSVGEKSEEILRSDSESKSQTDKEYEIFKKLLVAKNTRQLLEGEVYGIEPNEKLGKVIIAVIWNGVKVMIPDNVYFEDNFEFGERYRNATEEEKFKRRAIIAGYQNGARVCFVVKEVLRNVITGGEFDGEYNIVCVASRKEAMEIKRDIYFYHKERKHARENIREIAINDIAEANVIAVKQDNVLVECMGVETRIPAKEATDEYIENCKDVLQPGDKINVKIKKIHINGTSSVYLTVTGKLNMSSKLIDTMETHSSYIGFVEQVSRSAKDKSKIIYNVRLKNKVLACILAENVQGGVPLFIGDKVSVKVSKINDNFVYGSAMKL